MKILIVASDKQGKFAPFIEEQMAALQARSMEVLRYGITGKGITGYLRELPALRRAIKQRRPDIIHAHYGLSGLLANLQRCVPVVTTYHGSDINVPSILRFSKIAMRLSAHNIFVSKRNVAIALGDRANDECKVESVKCKGTENSGADKQTSTPYTLHPTPKNTLLPCGVNIPLPWSELQHQQVEQLTLNQWVQSKLDKEVKYVLFAGAFDNAVKDPALAHQVIEIANNTTSEEFINQQHKQHTSTIDRANQHPCAAGEIELIELKGYTRDQVTALMYNCHALLMTSKTEGSPQVVKEAMACGCPIVSVDVGDVAERTSGVEGCYVVTSREPKDIAEALRKALAFNGCTNGRERIIEMGLSNEQVAKQLESIYENVIGKRK